MDSGDTLLTILGDILDFSKIDHNRCVLAPRLPIYWPPTRIDSWVYKAWFGAASASLGAWRFHLSVPDNTLAALAA